MDAWAASLESYFTGWRDGYAQALDDVDSVIDGQRDGREEAGDWVSAEGIGDAPPSTTTPPSAETRQDPTIDPSRP